MQLQRSCGILMHISSLPGNHGMGTLGDEAYDFADFLEKAGQSYWQILPHGPVFPHLEYCPYVSPSTFAGNHLFISLDKLAEKKWVPAGLIGKNESGIHCHFADFHEAEKKLLEKMRMIFSLFLNEAPADERSAFESFCIENSWWLDDFALFSALSDQFKTHQWTAWDRDIMVRTPEAVSSWTEKLRSQILFYKYLQCVFTRQWMDWKKYCNKKNISIIGDIPIYISFDSADAWAHPEIFQLDPETGKPDTVAGVPPDYFSPTGQRWGNPLYKWCDDAGKLYEPTVQWWIKRLRQIHCYTDIIRIDHFRAFEDYWAIPEKEETAVNGEWRKGPGVPFFERIRRELGDLPLIAEDLGIITPAVEKLRDELGLPGMKILQFAFDGNPKNSYLPFNLVNPNCVVYTGTHDNHTTNGWYYTSGLDDNYKRIIRRYMNIVNDDDFHKKLIHYAYGTVASLVIIPAQDILGYGREFRMNTPGTIHGNWKWKLIPGALDGKLAEELKVLACAFNRIPEQK
ncbi:MAG: 4-alpha-glucanotransferase [Spirochaetota bacterium]